MSINNLSCAVCQDLIPLVKDNIASEDTKKAVYHHISNCKECGELFGDISVISNYKNYDEKALVKSIKTIAFIWLLLLVIFAAVVGFLSSVVEIGFYIALIVLPIIGLIGYFFTSKYWVLIPASAFFGYMLNDFYIRYIDIYVGNYLPSMNSIFMSLAILGISCLGVFAYQIAIKYILKEK